MSQTIQTPTNLPPPLEPNAFPLQSSSTENGSLTTPNTNMTHTFTTLNTQDFTPSNTQNYSQPQSQGFFSDPSGGNTTTTGFSPPPPPPSHFRFTSEVNLTDRDDDTSNVTSTRETSTRERGRRSDRTAGNRDGVRVQQESGRSAERALIADTPSNAPTAPQGGCNACSVLKYIAVAFAVTTLAFGVIGALIYFGKLILGWSAIGTISQSIGLYIMLGGLAASAITFILLTVKCCYDIVHARNQEQRRLELQHGNRDTVRTEN